MAHYSFGDGGATKHNWYNKVKMGSFRQRFKISHRKHSGRLRPHEHTSYLPLFVLLVVVGIVLSVATVSAATHPDPQASSVGLTGTMPGKPPTTGAVIKNPTNGQHFSTSPITISGSCPPGTLVEIYKNDIFAGSGVCASNGTFSFQIDLLIGENKLVARVYDNLNQPGPDSPVVTVFYDALPPQSDPLAPLNFGGTQMLLITDAIFRGTFPNQQMNMPISIVGGTAPYAVNVEWGDSSNKVYSRNDNQTFTASHTYKKAGIYQVILQGTDSQQRVAFLTVAAIVNGQPEPVASTTPNKTQMNKFLILWPFFAAAVACALSFYLGERREKKVLARIQNLGPAYH